MGKIGWNQMRGGWERRGRGGVGVCALVGSKNINMFTPPSTQAAHRLSRTNNLE